MELFDPDTWPARPLVMGIVNVTPDSFSDGGRFLDWERAVAHGLDLVREGADLLDVGGESTRPGADPVAPEEELERVLPVIECLAAEAGVPISVDTRRPNVARRALRAGASLVNAVGGLADPSLTNTVLGEGAGVCIVHMQGEPGTMQEAPSYGNVLAEIVEFLRDAASQARDDGIDPDRIWLDPGIGFGKTLDHNLQLLANLDRIAELGYPVLLGASRKRFIGSISGDPVGERVPGSLAALSAVRDLPRAVVRVHDVAATRQFLMVEHAIARREVPTWERPDGSLHRLSRPE